jgi:lysozyme
VDLELAGNCHARPAAGVVERELASFVRVVEGSTRRALVLYVGDDFASRYPSQFLESRPRWRRRVLRRPTSPWVVWQVSGNAHVDGIRGHADLDIMRG